MNQGAQSFVRCFAANFPQIIHQSRPKRNIRLLYGCSFNHRSRTCIQQQWRNRQQPWYFSIKAIQFSSTSSINTNTENTVHSTTEPSNDETKQTVPITFMEADGKERLVQAEIGKHLLDVAHDNHVELEGACGGELSCSTCHLIFEPHVYEKLTPKLDDEQDMLDLAFGVTETYVNMCYICYAQCFF